MFEKKTAKGDDKFKDCAEDDSGIDLDEFKPKKKWGFGIKKETEDNIQSIENSDMDFDEFKPIKKWGFGKKTDDDFNFSDIKENQTKDKISAIMNLDDINLETQSIPVVKKNEKKANIETRSNNLTDKKSDNDSNVISLNDIDATENKQKKDKNWDKIL